jgi:hypothetical protein
VIAIGWVVPLIIVAQPAAPATVRIATTTTSARVAKLDMVLPFSRAILTRAKIDKNYTNVQESVDFFAYRLREADAGLTLIASASAKSEIMDRGRTEDRGEAQTMQESQSFGVVVRTIGFFMLLYSSYVLFWMITRILGVNASQARFTVVGEFLAAVYFFVVGFGVMRSAGWISRWAYKISN